LSEQLGEKRKGLLPLNLLVNVHNLRTQVKRGRGKITEISKAEEKGENRSIRDRMEATLTAHSGMGEKQGHIRGGSGMKKGRPVPRMRPFCATLVSKTLHLKLRRKPQRKRAKKNFIRGGRGAFIRDLEGGCEEVRMSRGRDRQQEIWMGGALVCLRGRDI